ncbi:unnamed protein product, partial [Urochloa humidicola]
GLEAAEREDAGPDPSTVSWMAKRKTMSRSLVSGAIDGDGEGDAVARVNPAMGFGRPLH